MMQILKDIAGAALVFATLILMLGLENLAGAADSSIKLTPGDSFRVDCVVSPVDPPPIEPPPEPEPTPPPSASCPPQSHPNMLKWRAGSMQPGETTFRLDAGKTAEGLLFNSSTFWPGQANTGAIKRFTYVPHAVPQSQMHTLTFSRCAGDFRYDRIPRKCWAGGSEGSIRIVVQDQEHPAYCTLKPNTMYYLNIAALYPGSMRRADGGGVLIKVPR